MSEYADFEEFVSARRDVLLRTAYLLTGKHHDAEDLVQAALIKAVPKWTRIKDRPKPYIHRVLARESVSRWRRRRWREVPTDVLPESTYDETDDRLELLEDLRMLSPQQRAVLVLRYFEDLTEADTAAALGLSVGTVKSHARDALGVNDAGSRRFGSTTRSWFLDADPAHAQSVTCASMGPWRSSRS